MSTVFENETEKSKIYRKQTVAWHAECAGEKRDGGSCKPKLGGPGRPHKGDVMCEQRPGGGERVRHKVE